MDKHCAFGLTVFVVKDLGKFTFTNMIVDSVDPSTPQITLQQPTLSHSLPTACLSAAGVSIPPALDMMSSRSSQRKDMQDQKESAAALRIKKKAASLNLQERKNADTKAALETALAELEVHKQSVAASKVKLDMEWQALSDSKELVRDKEQSLDDERTELEKELHELKKNLSDANKASQEEISRRLQLLDVMQQ